MKSVHMIVTIFVAVSIPIIMAFSSFQPDFVKDISPFKLNALMQNQDIFLVDVHVPEQRHIKGTDLFVPFNRIKQNIDSFPQDRSQPVYLYCRVGYMGYLAAEELANLGYTNIYNLQGGTLAWEAAGF